MKKLKFTLFACLIVSIVFLASSYTLEPTPIPNVWTATNKTVNMFVSHGHCSTPFAGKFSQLEVQVPELNNQSNPLENLKLRFELDPSTFTVCNNKKQTENVTTPGLFQYSKGNPISFTSTRIFTRGLDWYEIIGNLTIKGVTKEVSFYATGIREVHKTMSDMLILEGQMDLMDWGIDYDLITTGSSNPVPTKAFHINFRIDFS